MDRPTTRFPFGRRVSVLVGRMLDTLAAFGLLWVPVAPLSALLDGPPPGHPERLRPDIPLSDLERAIAGELGGLPEVF